MANTALVSIAINRSWPGVHGRSFAVLEAIARPHIEGTPSGRKPLAAITGALIRVKLHNRYCCRSHDLYSDGNALYTIKLSKACENAQSVAQ